MQNITAPNIWDPFLMYFPPNKYLFPERSLNFPQHDMFYVSKVNFESSVSIKWKKLNKSQICVPICYASCNMATLFYHNAAKIKMVVASCLLTSRCHHCREQRTSQRGILTSCWYHVELREILQVLDRKGSIKTPTYKAEKSMYIPGVVSE